MSEEDIVLLRNEAEKRGVAPSSLLRDVAHEFLHGPGVGTMGRQAAKQARPAVRPGGIPSGKPPVSRALVACVVEQARKIVARHPKAAPKQAKTGKAPVVLSLSDQMRRLRENG